MAYKSLDQLTKRKRFDFALKMRDKPVSFWTDSKYGDEQQFRYDSEGKISLEYGSVRTDKQKSFLTWGCISSSSPATIRRLDGRFGSQSYITLLEEHIRPGKGECNETYFLHDNYPVHNCQAVRDWFKQTPGVTLLSLPPNSGDLMPLQNVFKKVESLLSSRSILVSSKDELWTEVSRMFNLVCSQSYTNEILNDLPNIVLSISENGGDFV